MGQGFQECKSRNSRTFSQLRHGSGPSTIYKPTWTQGTGLPNDVNSGRSFSLEETNVTEIHSVCVCVYKMNINNMVRISSVLLLSHVRLLATPEAAARQASLSITNSQSLLKLMSIELVMPSNHLILCQDTHIQNISCQWLQREHDGAREKEFLI